jgi:Flp pilus assembly protein TadB
VTATIFAAAVFAALTVWFALAWVAALRAEAAKTATQRRQDQIDADVARRQRPTFTARISLFVARYGWRGSLAPLAVGVLFGYLAIAAGLAVFGVGGWVGVAVALPVTAGAALLFTASVNARRQRLFRSELLDAFDQFAASVRTASSPAKAIEVQAPNLPEPLRSEMMGVVDQHKANRPLAEAVADVATRYPSRAMNLFVAALRVNEQRGGKLGSALEQAAESLRRDEELAAEAKAELAQDRLQFFGILGLLGVIAVVIFSQSGEEAMVAFSQPFGATVLIAGLANAAWGVVRVLRMFAKARGGI